MIKILLAIAGSIMLPFHPVAQTANYSGTWILNLKKSALEHRRPGLTSTVFIIKQEGDQFRLTRYHITGEKKNKISFKTTADGKTRRLKMLYKVKLEQKADGLLLTMWRKNYLNIVHYNFGNDENEFIADEYFTSKASKHHNIWVFDRKRSELGTIDRNYNKFLSSLQ